MKKFPYGELISGKQVSACTIQLATLWQDSDQAFVIVDLESLHEVDYYMSSHDLSQTCHLSRFMLVPSEESLTRLFVDYDPGL